MKKSKLIRLGIFIIILTVISTEYYLRKNWDKLFIYSTTPLIYQPDSVVGFKYIPNMTFYKSGKLFKINNHGFIGDNFSTSKKEGVFRIAVVGACDISGVLDNREYSNCCTTMQEEFNKNHWNVEIYNCGVDGEYRSYELFKSIKYQVIKFNPDLIICDYIIPFETIGTIREIYRGYILEHSKYAPIAVKEKYKSMIDNIYKYRIVFKLIDISYITKALCIKYIHFTKYLADKKLENEDISKKSDIDYKQKPHFNYFAKILELYIRKKNHSSDTDKLPLLKKFSVKKSLQSNKELLEEMKLKKIGFVYLLFSEKPRTLYLLKKNNIPYILVNIPPDETMFYDIDHLNIKGNRYLGIQLYKLVINNKLVPDKYRNNHLLIKSK